MENKNDQSLRDMLGYIKWSNIYVIGIPDGDERYEVEKTFEETLAQNLQKQDAKRTASRISTKKHNGAPHGKAVS